MKNILKKLHIMSPKESDDSKGRTLSKGGSKSCDGSPSDSLSPARSYHGSSDSKPFSALSSWLNSVAHKHISTSPPGSSSNAATGDSKLNPSPPTSLDVAGAEKTETSDAATSGCLDAALDAVRRDSGSSNSRDPDIEEEYQIQLALELSAREDPEAVQIEAVKQISLGSCPPENTPAEVIAFRYWKYNALSYDDKILDGFYDLCGVMGESTSERMPPLVDLQGTPLSDNINWEAVLVNRAADANLIKLEQKALAMASTSQSDSQIVSSDLLQRLAAFVADYMGGPVGDPDNISRAWRSLSYSLKATLGSMVLPLGSLTIGLARHRALLFKVLADSLGIPCRLVKGQQHTGFDNVAMNIVKIDNGREYIVDLMADPGTLIPSDAAGAQIDYEGSLFSASHLSRDIDSSHAASSGSEFTRSFDENLDGGTLNMGSKFRNLGPANESADQGESAGCIILSNPVKPDEESKETSADLKSGFDVKNTVVGEFPMRSTQPHMHAKSPSWTEGVSSPVGRKMKVKDVSQYMIDAAKENPQLAQKLHDVLLESGVVAPANLFTGIYSEQSNVSIAAMPPTKDNDDNEGIKGAKSNVGNDELAATCVFSPLPHHGVKPQVNPSFVQPDQPKTGEGLQTSLPCELRDMDTQPIVKNVPVAAAAAAAAAVVASSMVVAAAKSNTDSNIEFPVAAAATATAAAVAATTAAVGKKYSHLETSAQLLMGAAARFNQMDCMRNDRDVDGAGFEAQSSIDHGHDCLGANPEAERISDKSTSNDSTKSDIALDDVAECEIVWEDITVGERIGLGSYGEVYHGELHGTEVAVKKFLDQDISGEALVEFKSEVRIMKRLRHPNVVLFMGAVTRAPNLSIVTEFLPRGSLYRLIHRPNNQLDERRRLRMALDAARGMNYLHNCSPVIVHRDLKSPNLLVDKNWVVKVCDFGLSKMKHSTFLSSRSTAGTAEWMAPEVLRNEPSDEKCDVFSFGVILWELSTLQQPWGGMNPMQVVGAVGFQHRRLDIPHDMDPAIADIIQKCWHTDPKMRPKFSDIMDALKPLQKPITGSYAQRSGAGITPKGRTSQATEDP